MALLTPKDIREHTFQTVRFKEGYDVDEVDDFLDQVTETVEALGRQAVAGGQATQTLGPDVTNLNAKISDLTGQVQQLESENAGLKNAVAQAQQAAQAGNDQAAQLVSAKLSEAEESNRALSSQNEQLKGQVDQLNAQIDQLTAQAAQASGDQEAVGQQIAAIQQERDQFRAANEELSRQLAAAQQQGSAAQQQSAQIAELSRQLEEAKQRENQLRAQVSKVEPSTETGSLQKIAGAASMPGTEPERATAITIPMVLPPTVCGFILLYLCGRNTAFGSFFIDIGFPLIFSWPATVIAAVVVAFPLMYRSALGAFENLDTNMLDAARTLGWSNTRIFLKLMLPLSWSSIVAGTALAFARALGEFGATLFLAGNYLGITRTIPIAIYFEWMNGNDGVAWFWTAIVIGFNFIVFLFINLWSNRTTKYRKGAEQ